MKHDPLHPSPLNPKLSPTEGLTIEPMTAQEQVEALKPVSLPLPKAQQRLKIAGWSALTLFLLIFFTFIKLPKDNIKAYVDSLVAAGLAEQGITLSSKESTLSFFLGVHYHLKGITLTPPAPSPRITLEDLEISPRILPLILGKKTARIVLKDPKGKLDALVTSSKTALALSFEATEIDTAKLGLFSLATGVQGGGFISGSGDFSTDTADLTKTNGTINLNLKQVSLEPQTIMGFSVPKISISEGALDLNFEDAKGTLRTLSLGKQGSATDAIRGTANGTLTLAKQWQATKLDLKTQFSFSPTILKAFILLETILGAGKQPDGSFSFNLTGTLLSPTPSPVSAGGR